MHKHIGALNFISSLREGQFGMGTGLLVSPNLVLTCAHNLYNPATGEMYRDHKFYHGQCGPMKRHYNIEDFFFPSKYHMQRVPKN
jgi:V8-like Glu-specific endopeptidase